jgi:hypothetical protein
MFYYIKLEHQIFAANIVRNYVPAAKYSARSIQNSAQTSFEVLN